MADEFAYDVFLSHSAKDKAVVRKIAERLRGDGVRVWFDEWEIKPGSNIPSKIEQGLENSRVLVLCMSKHAFGSDWTTLESQTFRFRDPLNKDLRFIPLRLDEIEVRGILSQFAYLDWSRCDELDVYEKLLSSLARRPLAVQLDVATRPTSDYLLDNNIEHTQPKLSNGRKSLDEVKALRTRLISAESSSIRAIALTEQSKVIVSGASDGTVAIWNSENGARLSTFGRSTAPITDICVDERKRVYSACRDNRIYVWDIERSTLVKTLRKHTNAVHALALSPEGDILVSGGADGQLGIWDLESLNLIGSVDCGRDWVNGITFIDNSTIAVGSEDGRIRLWDLVTSRKITVLGIHDSWVWGLSSSRSTGRLVSGSGDSTVGLWNTDTNRRTGTLQGHTDRVSRVQISENGEYVLSGALDNTAKLWEFETGRLLADFRHHTNAVEAVALSHDAHILVTGGDDGKIVLVEFGNPEPVRALRGNVQYTNAKVVLAGDTSAGKTGLAHRLATGKWKPSDGSTVGAWSTQWPLPHSTKKDGVEREIWLWDFGGQSDQRLVHQLFLDHATLVLLLFNADQEDVLPGLRDWQTAIGRCVEEDTPQFLVAGRIDAGFRASREKLKEFAKKNGFPYFETSAQEGLGCKELHAAIEETIPWEKMPIISTQVLFKAIKDEVLKLRDEGQVLLTFKELRELLWQRLPEPSRCTDDVLRTVVGHLHAPGAVKELGYGTYILLQPEWVSTYAQAVLRTLRDDPHELGRLPIRAIAEGKLSFQYKDPKGNNIELKRLPTELERVVLGEMERELLERRLCLQQGGKLVFPSHCGRERPEIIKHPAVFVSYTVQGYLDEIYATLVVKLADSDSFDLKDLWRNAADFQTLAGKHHMGLKLTRESECTGEISVYFGNDVTEEEQVIFANYIHAHLTDNTESVTRLRHYVCKKCNTPKGNAQVLMEVLLEQKELADTQCDRCKHTFKLWDSIEKRFASKKVREVVEGLLVEDAINLDARRKGKLLALEVMARITSADQKCFEIPGTEDEGLDMDVEFTDDDGVGTGKRLYLQLKAGNSYLKTRKSDGAEIFAIKKQAWVKQWIQQAHPVMLVIGTFPDKDDFRVRGERKEFTDVRWMEISSVLRKLSANGTKPVRQIEFKGETVNMTTVRAWRDKRLREKS